MDIELPLNQIVVPVFYRQKYSKVLLIRRQATVARAESLADEGYWVVILMEDCADADIAGVSVNVKGALELGKARTGAELRADCKGVKALLLSWCPNKDCILLEQLGECLCYNAEVTYEVSVVSGKTKKSTESTDRYRTGQSSIA